MTARNEDKLIRRNNGYWDARNARTFTRFPMPLLQARWPAHQKTYDVSTVAARHFDREYAAGYVRGWNETQSDE